MLIDKELFTRHGASKVVYRELGHYFMYFVFILISFKAFYIEKICPTVFAKKAFINQQKMIANSETGKE